MSRVPVWLPPMGVMYRRVINYGQLGRYYFNAWPPDCTAHSHFPTLIGDIPKDRMLNLTKMKAEKHPGHIFERASVGIGEGGSHGVEERGVGLEAGVLEVDGHELGAAGEADGLVDAPVLVLAQARHVPVVPTPPLPHPAPPLRGGEVRTCVR